ncbi:hypothetical protein EV426DRAFT_605776 [Tirmania nivea]|nr:hypothetical protein EV426DRAFT_605776 [Tirmania nivea]
MRLIHGSFLRGCPAVRGMYLPWDDRSCSCIRVFISRLGGEGPGVEGGSAGAAVANSNQNSGRGNGSGTSTNIELQLYSMTGGCAKTADQCFCDGLWPCPIPMSFVCMKLFRCRSPICSSAERGGYETGTWNNSSFLQSHMRRGEISLKEELLAWLGDGLEKIKEYRDLLAHWHSAICTTAIPRAILGLPCASWGSQRCGIGQSYSVTPRVR